MNNIVELITQENYIEALKELESYIQTFGESSETDVLKATILLGLNLNSEFLQCVSNGIKKDYKNYELYFLLAEYYSVKNINQSYICLKQARYYCENEEDKQIITNQILSIESQVKVRKTACVILSYNTCDITKLCLDYVFENCDISDLEVVVIDNASTDGSVEMLQNYPGINLVINAENRGFPGGCNDGIAAAGDDKDILLLNSDALLLPNSLFWLEMGLYEAEDVGCTGSVTNYAANYQMVKMDDSSMETIKIYAMSNNVPLECPYTKKIFLIGFCLLIKREALNKVGLLDERFNPGNYEDTDYGMRMTEAGYKMLLCNNSFVYHFGHKSFEQINTGKVSLIEENRKKFIDKWGINLEEYITTRSEFADYIKKDSNEKFNLLEVGCGCGCTMGYLEGKYPNAYVEGVELNEKAAELGGKIFNINRDDFENSLKEYRTEFYDYILFGNSLETFYNPTEVLEKASRLLNRNGYVIASISNFMHISVLSQLLSGRLNYEKDGILDCRHIRFFTVETMIEMFMKAGLVVEDLGGVSSGDGYEGLIDRFMPIVGKNVSRSQLETYNYYLVGKKK